MMKRTFSILALLLGFDLAGIARGELIVSDGSELGIQVVGTIVQRQGEDNVALLKLTGGSVKAVKRKTELMNRFRVRSITSDFIELEEGSDKIYRIQPDKFAGHSSRKHMAQGPSVGQDLQIPEDIYKEDGFERQKSRIKMTGMYRDKLVKEDLARVLMQATVEPYQEGGLIAGFKISQIDAGSIYDKAGLLNGDIITHINEQELSSVANSIKLLQSLKGSNHMEVDVKRGDQKIRLTVDVH